MNFPYFEEVYKLLFRHYEHYGYIHKTVCEICRQNLPYISIPPDHSCLIQTSGYPEFKGYALKYLTQNKNYPMFTIIRFHFDAYDVKKVGEGDFVAPYVNLVNYLQERSLL